MPAPADREESKRNHFFETKLAGTRVSPGGPLSKSRMLLNEFRNNEWFWDIVHREIRERSATRGADGCKTHSLESNAILPVVGIEMTAPRLATRFLDGKLQGRFSGDTYLVTKNVALLTGEAE